MSDLSRFHEAQAPVYAAAIDELRAGHKQTHWMWFVLPQLAGLGQSAMSRRYAIADAREAAAYLADPVLGERLRACVAAVLEHPDATAHAIFGSPDDIKFRSCLTLFAAGAAAEVGSEDKALFDRALTTFYAGEPDPETQRLLSPAVP